MAACGVTGKDEVPSPFGVLLAGGKGGILFRAQEGAAGNSFDGVAAHICVKVSSGAVPPPVPAHFVQDILYPVALDAVASCIHACNPEHLVLVSFKVFFFRAPYAYV